MFFCFRLVLFVFFFIKKKKIVGGGGGGGGSVTGGHRKLHTEEFYHSYSSPHTIRVIK